jgi:hypothetical protein
LATAAAKTRRLGIGKAARGHELWQHLELLDDVVLELAAGLVARQRLVPVGRLVKGIPTHQHCPRLLGLVELQEKVRKAQDGAGTLAARAPDGLGQAVVSAMRERVAIDHQQGTLFAWGCASHCDELSLVPAMPQRRTSASQWRALYLIPSSSSDLSTIHCR